MPTTLTTTHTTKSAGAKSYTLLTLVGQIDESNLAEFEAVVAPLVVDAATYLVFDLAKLEFINSKVIGFLAGTHSQLAEKEKVMVFIKANPHIFDIIELVGLTQIVPTFETEEAAIAAIQAGDI